MSSSHSKSDVESWDTESSADSSIAADVTDISDSGHHIGLWRKFQMFLQAIIPRFRQTTMWTKFQMFLQTIYPELPGQTKKFQIQNRMENLMREASEKMENEDDIDANSSREEGNGQLAVQELLRDYLTQLEQEMQNDAGHSTALSADTGPDSTRSTINEVVVDDMPAIDSSSLNEKADVELSILNSDAGTSTQISKTDSNSKTDDEQARHSNRLYNIQQCYVEISVVDESMASDVEILSTKNVKSGTDRMDATTTNDPSTSSTISTRSGPRQPSSAFRRKIHRPARGSRAPQKPTKRLQEKCRCPECPTKYNRYGHLQIHMKTKHNWGPRKWDALKLQLQTAATEAPAYSSSDEHEH